MKLWTLSPSLSRCLTSQFVKQTYTRSFATSPLCSRTFSHSDKPPKSKVRLSYRPPFNQRFNTALTQSLEQLDRSHSSKDERTSWKKFRQTILQVCDERFSSQTGHSADLLLRFRLEETFGSNGLTGLQHKILIEYRNYKLDQAFSATRQEQKSLADIRYPTEWYPAARSLQRQIHLHVGPTNSGKTYQALQRLEKAKSGFYCGPLRLLAHEIYTRLNNKGISCGLVTGDEIKLPQGGSTIFSNTVEMAPLGHELEVGVIDEIQMIADPQRGWAWTRALLGAQARELHLCGEERVVPLIRELAALMGDKLEIHQYKRLNPLMAMSYSLKGDYKRLEKGDCVVAFSRVAIHALKQDIEKATGRRAAIVYGSLPAEIRAQQADLFNDPNNDYDFLVASDAIGMGLNLSCKRIIFDGITKRLPGGVRKLSVSELKQIGGRAGRYRSAAHSDTSQASEAENVGLVTSLEDGHLPYIRYAMSSDAEPLKAAGLLPSDSIIEEFARLFPPDTPFGYAYRRMEELVQTSEHFFICKVEGLDSRASILDDVKGLSVLDKIVFMNAPLQSNNAEMVKVAKQFARCVAENRSGALLDIPGLNIEILDQKVSSDKEYMRSLEAIHRNLILYLWLGYRFGGVFTDRTLATHAKELVEIKMDRVLTEFSANAKLNKAIRRKRVKGSKLQHGDSVTGVGSDQFTNTNIMHSVGAN
ncbi:RNA helicase [Myotisia sp. PD_48]|nr:RNA helicase [Myotisia sp. PD_48]